MSMLAKKPKSGPPRSAIYSCLHTSLRPYARQGPGIILRTQTSVVSNLRRVPRHSRGGGEALGGREEMREEGLRIQGIHRALSGAGLQQAGCSS